MRGGLTEEVASGPRQEVREGGALQRWRGAASSEGQLAETLRGQ